MKHFVLILRVCAKSTLVALCSTVFVACSTLGTIPGVSIAVDGFELIELMKQMESGDYSEESLRSMESRPMPAPPGLSHDIAAARRGLSAFMRGNLPLVIESSRTIQRHGTDPGLMAMMMGLEAAAEAGNGRMQSASLVLREREKRWSANPQPSGLFKANGGDFRAVEIGAQTSFALEAAQLDEVERLLRTYEKRSPATTEGRRLWFQVHMLTQRGKLLAAQGDVRGGYNLVRDALSLHRASFGGAKKLPGSTAAMEAEQEQWVLSDLVRISLSNGVLSQTRDHLSDLKRAVGSAGNRRSQLSDYYVLEADYFEAVGRSKEALESLDRSWASGVPFTRNSPVKRLAYFLSRSRNQIVIGDSSGSLNTLEQLGPPSALEDSVQRDALIRQLTLTEVLVGRNSSTLPEMDRLDQRFQQRMGTHDSLQHFATKVIAYGARGSSNGNAADQVRAVEAGRLFSRAIRSILSSGGNLNGSPSMVQRLAKEAYLGAAASSVGRDGITPDDLLDAISLMQLSDTDADIAMAATRQKQIPGVSADQLRRLQDLQQVARSKQRLVAEYARSNDLDPARMSEIAAQASTAAEQLSRALASMEASAPNLVQALSTRPPNTRAVRARLVPGEAVLAAASTSDRTIVLLISSQNVEHSSVPLGSAEISSLVKRVRDSVTFNEAVQVPVFDTDASKALHAKLLGWAGRSLAQVKSLTAVVGGTLGSVPFGLLLDPVASGSDYRTMPWLIKSMAVTHMPSIASWYAVSTGAAPVRSNSFIAWADPDFGSPGDASVATRAVRKAVRGAEQRGVEEQQQRLPANLAAMLPALPETKTEAQAVARALRASAQSDVVAGGQATRSSVIAASESGALAQKGVVMFATHGLAPAQVPGLFQPALAMAREPGDQQPSLLQLDDVVGLRMNADWVLLSACNTASADRAGGDAMSGLARGFFFAGAKSLLVTHWEVESESAAAITTKTMERYAANPRLSRAQALQATSIDLIDAKRTPREWAHPAFWAAYALVGDGRRSAGGTR